MKADRYLVDTHVLIWAASQPKLLTQRVRKILESPDVAVLASPVSAYEIVYKHHLGKLPGMDQAAAGFSSWLRGMGFGDIPLTLGHLAQAASFDVDHSDPWDRILAAQAHSEDMPLISTDKVFDRFPVNRIW